MICGDMLCGMAFLFFRHKHRHNGRMGKDGQVGSIIWGLRLTVFFFNCRGSYGESLHSTVDGCVCVCVWAGGGYLFGCLWAFSYSTGLPKFSHLPVLQRYVCMYCMCRYALQKSGLVLDRFNNRGTMIYHKFKSIQNRNEVRISS